MLCWLECSCGGRATHALGSQVMIMKSQDVFYLLGTTELKNSLRQGNGQQIITVFHINILTCLICHLIKQY
jgi:hypothetical protein